MKRVGLVVAYDGTNYSGWQIQPNGITIQGVLNDALTDLLGEKIEIMGASRTDAGVHALGNVAVFDTNTRIPGEKISYALNQRLHDFASFCGTGAQVKSTVRTLTGIDIWRDGDIVTIRVKGEGFLYNMVRIIAGTLIQVGNGQYPPERVKKILDACDRSVSGPTAPAHGLTLMGIEFF